MGIFLLDAIMEDGFNQGLVGDIPFVCHELDVVEHGVRETEGDATSARLEFGKIHFYLFELIGEIKKTMSVPKVLLLLDGIEARYLAGGGGLVS